MRQSRAPSCSIVTFLFITVSLVGCQSHRLSRALLPSVYDINILIDLENLKFNGSETIHVHSHEPSYLIELHSLDLNVSDLTVLDDGLVVPYEMLGYDDLTQTYSIVLDRSLVAGRDYEIKLSFEGEIKDDMKGLYRSSYFEAGSTVRYMATTFSAAAYARKIFPCFDEPAFKAMFHLTITNKNNYVTLANTRINSTELIELESGEIWRTTKFEPTPVMSTYLLAFAISEFRNTTIFSDVEFSVYSSSKSRLNMQYALETGIEALKALEEYVGHKYQLDKMDFIAIDDFLMGAMENWGLISYKSSRIMNPVGLTNRRNIQEITNIIVHELVHMFFGNQVTCEYWDYVWLNEGFATYLENKIADKLLPNLHILDYFVVNRMHSVMLQDVKPKTHAMTRRDVITPDDISTIYDFVAYPKAASVIRMIEHVMTPEIFQKSLNSYIAERSFKTATDEELYEILDRVREAEGQPNNPKISEVFRSWANNPSYPILNVDFNPADKIAVLSQELFIPFINQTEKSEFLILFNYASASLPIDFEATTHKNFVSAQPENQTLAIPDDEKWVIFNNQQTGYYRVNYDARNWNAIIDELHGDKFNLIHVLNRAQLLDDSFNLARSDYLDFTVTLNLLKYLRNETELIPLEAGFKTIDFLLEKLDQMEYFKDLRDILLDIVDAIYVNVNSDATKETAESEDYHVLRKLHVNLFACRVGAKSCLSHATERLFLFDLDAKKLDIDERPYLYCGIMGEDLGTFHWARFKLKISIATEEVYRDSQEEFNEMFDAVSKCDTNLQRVEQLLNDIFIVTNETSSYRYITKENALQVVKNLIKASSAHRGLMMKFFSENFDAVNEKAPLKETLSAFVNAINTQAHLTSFVNLTTTAGLSVSEMIAEIEENIRWMTLKAPEISMWVESEKSVAVKLQMGVSILTFLSFMFLMVFK